MTQTTTTPRERFLAAAHGRATDRPPVGAWVHFGTATASPQLTAALHLNFLESYGWDYLKTMHDFRLPVPIEGDLRQRLEGFATLGTEWDSYARQRAVLAELRRSAPDVAIVETQFSPFQTTIRSLGEGVVEVFKADPGLADQVIGRTAELLALWVGDLAGLGVDAVFLALTGASADASSYGITEEQYRRWVAPHDITVLRAAEGLVRIAHVHGDDVHTDWLAEHPYEVLSWAERSSGPSIQQVLDAGRVPLVGLDERSSLYLGTEQVHQLVASKRREAGDRIIVGPNCTMHTDTNPEVFHALRSSVEVAL